MWRDKPRMFAEKACHKCLEKEKFALGKTKIFFRTGQVALLERIRVETLSASAILIQSCWRGFVARRKFLVLRKSLLTIQLRYEKSAVIIQKYWRGYLVRRASIERRKKIVLVQCCVRRWLARRRLRELKIESRSVLHLQKLNTGLENKIIDLKMKLDLMTAERNRLARAEVTLEKLRAEMGILEAER
ncbi:unnamed protein product [Heligmosomoides polygyrus]|uniref:Myosin motor domain-containing protein n=1 Tax=Heligmosomoides polygyrus TaxID=6339 RepID=A0A3P7UPU2_HELPZ|nr:unnamed protein product [Heligmosomoides polygyrus]